MKYGITREKLPLGLFYEEIPDPPDVPCLTCGRPVAGWARKSVHEMTSTIPPMCRACDRQGKGKYYFGSGLNWRDGAMIHCLSGVANLLKMEVEDAKRSRRATV